MDSEKWYKYYNYGNAMLLRALKRIESGTIEVEVHEKRPVNIYLSKAIEVPDLKSHLTKLAWYDYYKPRYLEVIQLIHKVRFGKLQIHIQDHNIISVIPIFRMRLQKKHEKNT